MAESNALDQARELLERRLSDLDDERKRLERALRELGSRVTGTRRPASSDGRRKGATNGSRSGKRRTRQRGTRAEQALKLVSESPGITASEVASAMKLKPNYLYRVLGGLEKDKRVRKKGRTYFPVGG